MYQIQIIVLAVIQGFTELFPISSLGHTIIVAGILNWHNILNDKNFVNLIVALHLGTTLALLIYYRQQWVKIIKGLFLSIREGNIKYSDDAWLSWLIIVGSLPAGLIGVFFESTLKKLFSSPYISTLFLIINGLVLILGDRIIKNKKKLKLRDLRLKDAIFIGLFQTFALLPGISRSGITLIAGLLSGLSLEDAGFYAFMLLTPIIGAAAIIEIPPLLADPNTNIPVIILGMCITGIMSYITTVFLAKYFKLGKLLPFGLYCITIGILAIVYFKLIA